MANQLSEKQKYRITMVATVFTIALILVSIAVITYAAVYQFLSLIFGWWTA